MVYIPIWTIKDQTYSRQTALRRIVYIPIWTIKDKIGNVIDELVAWFTFQYGRLKTDPARGGACARAEFTFQYGRLKTETATAEILLPSAFTFQYGRLKTGESTQVRALPAVYIPIWTIKDWQTRG